MFTVVHLNLLGLMANMSGVVIAFRFGYPQPSFDEDTMMAFEGGTIFSDGTSATQNRDEARNRKKLYSRLARLGLLLMFVGFALQFVAQCLSFK
jgi:hypothetical protein